MDLSLVNIGSGEVLTARSNDEGAYELDATPGAYLITGDSRAGLSVSRAPAVVNVEAGQVASADLDFVALAVPVLQETTGEGGATIQHEAVGCMVAGEFPILDANIEPATAVVRARVYFRSGLSDEWYFVEMTQTEGVFRSWLPRPQIAASPISYYIQTTTTDFGENRTEEHSAIVVEFEDECEDRVLAAYGPPPADLTVFSASTGAAAGIPAGFAAGGLALGAGAIAGIVALVTAAGVTVSRVVDSTPTPEPTAEPTATPAPTATPTPTPQECRLTVTIDPGADLGTVEVQPDPPGGVYECGTRATLTAVPRSISTSPPREVTFIGWGGDCAYSGRRLVCILVMDTDAHAIAGFQSDLITVTP